MAVTAGSPARPLQAELRLRRPFDLAWSLGSLAQGRRDPAVRLEGRTWWRATRTPDGPATQAVTADPAAGAVRCWAWGPGAPWLLDGLADLTGAADDVDGFAALVATDPGPRRPAGWSTVAALARRRPGLRIPRTAAVVEACVPAVLAQKVTGLEAKRSYREMVVATGEAAPGPAGPRCLLLPPTPATLRALPSWTWHRLGVERRRSETIRRVAAGAARLEEAATLERRPARQRLEAVAGVGAWTSAEVALVAFGDPDAVSIGDFHLPNLTAWMLAGRARGDDALMLELLEPWRGHRGRVLRLLESTGTTAPKFGPRQPIRSWRRW